MPARLECVGGPLDGRAASKRSLGTRAYIDRAGRVYDSAGPGRALYMAWGDCWEFVGYIWRRCGCGAWVQSDSCRLCGAQTPG